MNPVALFLTLSVSILGHSDFSTRQQTERFLTQIWPLSADVVFQGYGNPDPEIRCRCGRIVEGFARTGP